MGLLTDKDEKTVVYKVTGEQKRTIIVLIVDNPEMYYVSASTPYEVIIIIGCIPRKTQKDEHLKAAAGS